MSSIILDSSPLPIPLGTDSNPAPQHTCDNNDQTPWLRGVTQGIHYQIHGQDLVTLTQTVGQEIRTAKRTTQLWMLQAVKTQTNIVEIVKALKWTINDIAEVSEHPRQHPLLNLQRERTIWQLNCCQIIHKVSERLIKTTAELAKQRLTPADTFQSKELENVTTYYARQCALKKGNMSCNIQAQEEKCLMLRKQFLEHVSFLLRDPVGYRVWALKAHTQHSVEHTCRTYCNQEGMTPDTKARIDELRFNALASLEALDCTTPEEMWKSCNAIANKVNRTLESIQVQLCLHVRWMSGNCHADHVEGIHELH